MTGRQLLQIVQIDCVEIPFQVRLGSDRSALVARGIKLDVPVPRYLIVRPIKDGLWRNALERSNHYRTDYRTAD